MIIGGIFLLSNIYEPLDKIAKNTEPLDINNINILWWSFFIAIFSLIAGIIAAWYSYKGYKFQRISAKHLETLVPGHMSYYEIVGSLLNNILDIESLFFGHKDYNKYPVKIFLATSKLPYELIHLEKYEKDKACYDEAFKLSIAWQNYNNMIDLLVEYTEKRKGKKKVLSFAQFLIDLTKTEIVLVQKFESFLFKKGHIAEKTATDEKISWYLFNRFLETIKTLSLIEIKDFDVTRSNLTKKTKNSYIYSIYLPNNFDISNYLEAEHKNRLSDVGGEYSSFYSYDPKNMIDSIKKGEYNMIGNYIVMPKNKCFSEIDFSDFKSCYYNYIEPLILGYKRYEFSIFLE